MIGWAHDPDTAHRGTLSIYFFALGVVAVPSLGWVSVGWPVLVAVAVAALAGDLLGRLLLPLVSARQVRLAVLGLSAAGGVLTLCHALF
ncbi:hypothetical protein [Amycolatopsis sp. H20-H5]|uniref:hypothetical protein n=1 Tax=Amycolatopsis sp. H20-H5 TaxID=3046309 RepID=UPI002DBB10CB|nr:hypothetical protein [Amycolatopsis sp. H20-H5]MEC3977557.1 hypothetical protein [Amycolatopsis sp. H20-H5]